MSLVYAEFPSDLPPSMPDEEIKRRVEKYREKNQRKDNYKRKDIGFIQEEVDEVIEEEI